MKQGKFVVTVALLMENIDSRRGWVQTWGFSLAALPAPHQWVIAMLSSLLRISCRPLSPAMQASVVWANVRVMWGRRLRERCVGASPAEPQRGHIRSARNRFDS